MQHKTTKIGSYCLIGAKSLIMPGVRIGDHCVVGAGSIVLGNVPSNCIVMDNPARVIERGVEAAEYGVRK